MNVLPAQTFKPASLGNLPAQKSNTGINKTSINDQPKLLSFMSIPVSVYKANISFTRSIEPKSMDYSVFARGQYKYEKSGLAVKYTAYSQDPLVNKHPETYIIKGDVRPGPVNARFKVVDDSSEPAIADKNGAFIPKKNSAQFDRVNAFVIANKTLEMYEKALGRDIKWAFDDEQLLLKVRAGEGNCANYHRGEKNIKLFYFKHLSDPQEMVYTARMADLISHEVGHAVLDSLRPTNIGWGKDGRSIHEGFADITAMLLAVWNDNLLDQAINETGGDLRKDNVISFFAEQFGQSRDGTNCLRNLNNDLKFSTFGFDGELKEEHNYGRLLGGTFYEIMTECANINNTKGDLKSALQQTRDELTNIIIKAVGDYSPERHTYYSDIALSVLTADKLNNNGKYFNELKKVFIKRELLTEQQISQWQKEQAKLPQLKLNKTSITSVIAMEDFINSNLKPLDLPLKNKYEVAKSYTNDYGEAFITLKALQHFKPGDKEYKPDDDLGGIIYSPRTYDVLKVAFDKTGNLIFKETDRIEDIEIIEVD